MARTKTLDSIISQTETEVGIATKVAKMIREFESVLQDTDDACLAAGREYGEWILHITNTEMFKSTIKAVLGGGKFNEEFFLDGLKEAVSKDLEK
jgi:hypothetical protein